MNVTSVPYGATVTSNTTETPKGNGAKQTKKRRGGVSHRLATENGRRRALRTKACVPLRNKRRTNDKHNNDGNSNKKVDAFYVAVGLFHVEGYTMMLEMN